MGGIIEDKIFEVLLDRRMTVREVQEACGRIGYRRTRGIIGRHLRKMVSVQQLAREKSDGRDVYYNPAMVETRR